MNMQINSYNNMAMMYSMVGLPQGSQAPRQINRTLDTGSQISPKGKSDESKGTKKESFFPEFQKASQNSKSESELSGTGRRYVGEEIPSHGGRESASEQNEQHSDLSNSPGTLDTARQIQFKFQSQNNFTSKKTASPEEQSRMKRQQQMSNLKQWVDLEYKQYVKNSEMPYTRRDLREISGALDTKDKSLNQNFTSPGGKNASGISQPTQNNNFNILNLTKVARTMNFLEDPVPSIQSESKYL